jgi:hypothetical protein
VNRRFYGFDPYQQHEEALMAKYGLPVYPIYDGMPLETNIPEEIEWLVEHGMLECALKQTYSDGPYALYHTSTLPKSPAGLPLIHREVTRHPQGKYVYIAMDENYRGDDPYPKHFVLRWYESFDALRNTELLDFADHIIRWWWYDWKPDLFHYLDERLELRR